MPMDFQIKNGIVVFTTVGELDYQEGINVLKEGLHSIKGSNPALILFDIRQSQENRTHDEILNISEFIKPFILEKAKIALLVEHDLYFGLSRMFASYVEEADIEAQVFKKYDDALSWLTQ
jgi:hypothetical protein